MKLIPFVFALAIFATPSAAQNNASASQLKSQELSNDAYLIKGGIANTGFVVGPDSVIVIDAQRSRAEGAAQITLIGQTTSKPIAAVIITHGDPDHVGGLPAHPASAHIIMQENTWAQIMIAGAKADQGGPLFGPIYKELAANHLVDQTVETHQNMKIGGIPIELIHIAPAHTSGDLIIYFPQQKIVFAGDIVQNNQGRFPVIHIGGSSLGWIASMKKILALNAAVIVPGHGPIMDRAELEQRVKDVEQRRAAIKTMIESRKSFKEIDAALPAENVYPIFPNFNRTTYDELVKGYPEQVPPWESLVTPPSSPSSSTVAASHQEIYVRHLLQEGL